MIGTQKRWQEDLFVAGPLSSLIPEDHILKPPSDLAERLQPVVRPGLRIRSLQRRFLYSDRSRGVQAYLAIGVVRV